MADFLTPDQYDKYVPASLRDDADLERQIRKAERAVIDRYRRPLRVGTYNPVRHPDPDDGERLPSRGAKGSGGDVQLDGWEQDSNGDPDVAAMDAGLVDAIRETCGRYVEYQMTSPDRHVALKSQGSRSVAYRTTGMPPTVFQPLQRYDLRTPLM